MTSDAESISAYHRLQYLGDMTTTDDTTKTDMLAQILDRLGIIDRRLKSIEANQKTIHSSVVNQGKRLTQIETEHSEFMLQRHGRG